jgi:hypothetical protein
MHLSPPPMRPPARSSRGPGAAVVGALASRRIGGINGDVLGAAQQVAEMSILLFVVGAAHGTSPLAWWWP